MEFSEKVGLCYGWGVGGLRRWAFGMLNVSGALIWGLGMLTLVTPLVAVPAVVAGEAYLRFLAEGGALRIKSLGSAIGIAALGGVGLLVGGGIRLWWS
jgi:hypothetical protein